MSFIASHMLMTQVIRNNASRINTANAIRRNQNNMRKKQKEEKAKQETTENRITEDEYMEILFNSLGE